MASVLNRLDHALSSVEGYFDHEHRRRVLAIAVVCLFLVLGGATTVVGHWAHRGDQTSQRVDFTAKGLVKTSCVLVQALDQQVASQHRSAQTGQEILNKLPPGDPSRATRQRSVAGAKKQVAELGLLVTKMRTGVTCPPAIP